jgi:hypothetical protein
MLGQGNFVDANGQPVTNPGNLNGTTVVLPTAGPNGRDEAFQIVSNPDGTATLVALTLGEGLHVAMSLAPHESYIPLYLIKNGKPVANPAATKAYTDQIALVKQAIALIDSDPVRAQKLLLIAAAMNKQVSTLTGYTP